MRGLTRPLALLLLTAPLLGNRRGGRRERGEDEHNGAVEYCPVCQSPIYGQADRSIVKCASGHWLERGRKGRLKPLAEE